MEELNQLLMRWLDSVGNRKRNETTGYSPQEKWTEEKLQPINEKKEYDTSYISFRKVHWDGSFSYKGESWILSSMYAGKEILVKESLEGSIRIFYQGEEISKLQRRKKVIPFSEKITKKQTVVVGAPQPVSLEVDTRPLSVYDEFTRGESS